MLDDHPDDFFLVQIHKNDGLGITWGETTRAAFYGYQGTPDAWFDGVTRELGGTGNVSADYSRYLAAYNLRKSVPTDVTIGLEAKHLGETVYQFRIRPCIEADGTGKTMRIYLVHVLDYYGAGSYGRNCLRQAFNTWDVDVAAGGCIDLLQVVGFDATSWASQEDIKMIAWAQEPLGSAPAEVYQAARLSWPFPVPTNEALAVRSYKDHDTAGVLGLDMGLTGAVEPRMGGITDLEIDLDDAWPFSGGVVVDCDVAWAGAVTTIGPTGDTLGLLFDPALPDQAYCVITLDSGAEVCVRSCEGDLNLSGGTTTADALQAKIRFGQSADETNCEWDFNLSGAISTADALQIKIRFGFTAPDCP